MKLVLVAGGGGHFSAALSVIEALPRDVSYIVFGRKYTFEGDSTLSFEYQTAREKHIPFEAITTGRVQRIFTKHTIPSLLKTPIGLVQSLLLLQKHKPDVVLSFGGYVVMPVVLAAYLLKIPIVIHEQAMEAGFANKISSVFAKKICVSWESSHRFFPKDKTVVTGFPIKDSIRKEVSQRVLLPKGNLPLLVVTGGSGGSHELNMFIEKSLPELLDMCRIFHQTGDAKRFNDYDRLISQKESLPKEKKDRYEVEKFVDPDQIGVILRKADLVVARAGINTVSELLYLEKPALLVPLQSGQHNEQMQNAKFFQSTGLGIVLSDDRSDGEFLRHIKELLSNLDSYSLHTKSEQEKLTGDASEQIFSAVKEVAESSK